MGSVRFCCSEGASSSPSPHVRSGAVSNAGYLGRGGRGPCDRCIIDARLVSTSECSVACMVGNTDRRRTIVEPPLAIQGAAVALQDHAGFIVPDRGGEVGRAPCRARV